METETHFKKYPEYVAFRAERYGKAILFENEHVLVGLNCLNPGQSMEKHAHEEQTRFYLVLEGKGQVRVGDEVQEVEPQTVIWVPNHSAHRLENAGSEPLVLLVGITPAHAD